MPGPIESGGTAARRLIKQSGQTVTLSTESESFDTDSDWDDVTVNTETLAVPALVTRTRQQARVLGDEAGTRTKVDFVVWVEREVDDRITLTDYSGSGEGTKVTFGGVEYDTVLVDRSIPGVVRLEVAR